MSEQSKLMQPFLVSNTFDVATVGVCARLADAIDWNDFPHESEQVRQHVQATGGAVIISEELINGIDSTSLMALIKRAHARFELKHLSPEVPDDSDITDLSLNKAADAYAASHVGGIFVREAIRKNVQYSVRQMVINSNLKMSPSEVQKSYDRLLQEICRDHDLNERMNALSTKAIA